MTLVIMAAGMGSRYGGLKQIESVGPMVNLLLIILFMMRSKLDLQKLFLSLKKKIMRYLGVQLVSESKIILK